MEVRIEVIEQAVKEYVDEMFSKTELNMKNAINAIGAKVLLHNKIGKFLPMLANEEGLIDVDFLEQTTRSEIKKLGSFLIPAIGTSYKITEEDAAQLFAKIRNMSK